MCCLRLKWSGGRAFLKTSTRHTNSEPIWGGICIHVSCVRGAGRNRRGEDRRMTEDAACLVVGNCLSF